MIIRAFFLPTLVKRCSKRRKMPNNQTFRPNTLSKFSVLAIISVVSPFSGLPSFRIHKTASFASNKFIKLFISAHSFQLSIRTIASNIHHFRVLSLTHRVFQRINLSSDLQSKLVNSPGCSIDHVMRRRNAIPVWLSCNAAVGYDRRAVRWPSFASSVHGPSNAY